MSFFLQRNSIFWTHFEQQGHPPTTLQRHEAIQKMHQPTTPKQVCAFFGLVGYYRKYIKDFAKIVKAINSCSQDRQVKFEWAPAHQESLHETERFHHTSTNSMIPQPQQEIYSLH